MLYPDKLPMDKIPSGGEAMIPLEPTRNPEYAAPVNPLETEAADAAYLAQTLLEMGNAPEMVMREETAR